MNGCRIQRAWRARRRSACVGRHCTLAKRRRRMRGTFASALLCTLGMVSACNSEPPRRQSPAGTKTAALSGDPETLEIGMNLVGFDEKVARANGYEIVTLPDGAQASVPADLADAARSGAYRPEVGVLAP